MKTQVATALSVVGILGAGSAAALVNTRILDSGAAESTVSAAVLPTASTVDITVPDVTDSTVPVTVADDTTTTVAAVVETTVPQATGFLTAYNVGDAGVVTVDVIDGQLMLISAVPNAGWDVTTTDGLDDDTADGKIEVEFISATVRVEFDATLVDGQIVPRVESKSVGGTATSPSPASKPPTAAPPATSATSGGESDDDRADDHHSADDAEHESDDHGDDHGEDSSEDHSGEGRDDD
jgi:hypothetical protein